MSPHLDITAPYLPLVRRISTEGCVDAQQLLRIDHFLNHRIEPNFMFELAHELAQRLSYFQPNLILTAEASGIAPALVVAQTLRIPMVYAKKYSPQVEPPAISRIIPSPTKGGEVRLVVSARYIQPGQRVVLVDDFLAGGRTAVALIDMAREAGAEVLGAGFVVEKCYTRGRQLIEGMNVPVASLAQIESIADGQVHLRQPQASN
ncbi:MAG: xanthine phosphoribosyltransferase [Zoogloea sp.]|uniref:xanthine phosphoribosyltransferase n=1 Tax=Zoogloea sp. TaxID=49181 RepID=UPI003F2CF0B2|nr:xanthine phosphoribosyltransferase [Rhodocyclales bacterium]